MVVSLLFRWMFNRVLRGFKAWMKAAMVFILQEVSLHLLPVGQVGVQIHGDGIECLADLPGFDGPDYDLLAVLYQDDPAFLVEVSPPPL